MFGLLLRHAGLDLQRQFAGLKAQAEDLKDRAIGEVRGQIVSLGVTAGLAAAGAVFALLTLAAGMAALYVWIAERHGPLAALGAVAGVNAAAALVLFAAAAMRSRPGRTRPVRPRPQPQAVVSSRPSDSLLSAAARNASDRAVAATDQALDAAAERLRTGSRGTVLATLVVAGAIGVILGRRR